MNNLANILKDEGKLHEAENLLRRAVQIRYCVTVCCPSAVQLLCKAHMRLVRQKFKLNSDFVHPR
jgi:hypothetical protein